MLDYFNSFNGCIGTTGQIQVFIGLFHARLDKPTQSGELLGQASYWVYLIHFPIVVAAGGIVSVIDTSAIVKYLLTIAISVPIIALSYYLLVLKTPLKSVIVGKSKGKAKL